MRLNAEKGGRELAERYGVSSFPTIVFADASGEEVERIGGYLPPDRFVDEVRRVRGGDTFAACLETLEGDPGNAEVLERAVAGLLERSDPEGAIARIRAYRDAAGDAGDDLCRTLLLRARVSLHDRLYGRTAKLFQKGLKQPLEAAGEEAGAELKALLDSGWDELDRDEQARRLREARHGDAGEILAGVSAEELSEKELFEVAGFAFSSGHYDTAADLYRRWFTSVAEEADAKDLNQAAWSLYLCGTALDEAVVMARQAYAADDSPMIADTLARLLYVTGSVDAAITLQAKATEQVEGEIADEFGHAAELMRAGESLGDRPDFETYPG